MYGLPLYQQPSFPMQPMQGWGSSTPSLFGMASYIPQHDPMPAYQDKRLGSSTGIGKKKNKIPSMEELMQHPMLAQLPPPERNTELYRTLQLPTDSTIEQVERAFKHKAYDYHPDRNKTEVGGEKFRKMNMAKLNLTDPEYKGQYDQYRQQDKAATREWATRASLLFGGKPADYEKLVWEHHLRFIDAQSLMEQKQIEAVKAKPPASPRRCSLEDIDEEDSPSHTQCIPMTPPSTNSQQRSSNASPCPSSPGNPTTQLYASPFTTPTSTHNPSPKCNPSSHFNTNSPPQPTTNTQWPTPQSHGSLQGPSKLSKSPRPEQPPAMSPSSSPLMSPQPGVSPPKKTETEKNSPRPESFLSSLMAKCFVRTGPARPTQTETPEKGSSEIAAHYDSLSSKLTFQTSSQTARDMPPSLARQGSLLFRSSSGTGSSGNTARAGATPPLGSRLSPRSSPSSSMGTMPNIPTHPHQKTPHTPTAHQTSPTFAKHITSHRASPTPVQRTTSYRASPTPIQLTTSYRSSPTPAQHTPSYRNSPTPASLYQVSPSAAPKSTSTPSPAPRPSYHIPVAAKPRGGIPELSYPINHSTPALHTNSPRGYVLNDARDQMSIKVAIIKAEVPSDQPMAPPVSSPSNRTHTASTPPTTSGSMPSSASLSSPTSSSTAPPPTSSSTAPPTTPPTEPRRRMMSNVKGGGYTGTMYSGALPLNSGFGTIYSPPTTQSTVSGSLAIPYMNPGSNLSIPSSSPPVSTSPYTPTYQGLQGQSFYPPASGSTIRRMSLNPQFSSSIPSSYGFQSGGLLY